MAVDDDDVARTPLAAFLWVLVGLALSLAGPAAAATDPGWRAYQDRFITREGRVVDTGNGNISHTEGQGWAMLMAVYFDDPDRFDALYDWTREHLRRKVDGLYTWRFDPGADPAAMDPNNATDGDLLIAWALELAGRHWERPRYRLDSERLRAAIRRHLIIEYGGYQVLLPGRTGFQHDGYVNLNPSYYVMPALDCFARLDPGGPWRRLMYDGIRLIELARKGGRKLPPDWVRLDQQGALSLAEQWPPRFGFEAVRVPLYFYWMGLGDVALLDGVRRFWMRPRPPAWVDLETGESADFPLSRGGLAVRALMLGNGDSIPLAPQPDDDYYSASLLMLSRMAFHPAPLSSALERKKL